jgi:serine/threonine protein kinase
VVAGDSPEQLSGLLTGLAPGARVAGYRLEKLVGVGGMAAVYRARDERLGRVVALKLLAGDDLVQRRFTREARAVAAVDHPHIIPVYDAGEAGGVLYIAMRFVAGDDLRVIVEREGGLRPHRTAAVISPVASALDAAHGAGLVHRDVKPANILVDAAPGRPAHVYLSDFGLARGVKSVSGLTQAGQFMGTPDYSAPEQISGREVDGRADQYALGCVAYALLTGSVPFRREVPMAVLYAHLSAPPPRVTAARPDLSEAVDEVLARALAKEPDDRYDSCGDFAYALRDALNVDPYDPSRPVRPSTQTWWVGPQRSPDPERSPDPGRVPGGLPPSRVAATAPLTVPPDPAPTQLATGNSPLTPVEVPPRVPPRVPPAAAATWTAVVAADRGYYDSVQAENDQDAGEIVFPDRFPARRFRLSGTEVRIGRRSVSQHIEPEIDLTGPPRDPGVSRLHAVLTVGPDGTWSVKDADSDNGIRVNGRDVPPQETVPLRHGDRIHLGAWTVITVTRD